MGECTNEQCQFVHGLVCDMCQRACIHPYDEKQQRQHFAVKQLGALDAIFALLRKVLQECLQEHELAMEQAFAEAKGEGKCCGICMENIMEKSLRFGILEGCRHCFCLDCIREWRRNQTFETEVIRSCPECRQHSNFVIPSVLWVEDEEEKKILCEVYRNNMAQKQCKYYKEGVSAEGCPFGNKCFYKHQLPDGSIDPGEEPHARRKPHLSDFIFRRSSSHDDEWLDEEDEEEEARLIRRIRAMLAE
ncbi:zinc finger, C3HC4 type [Oesophagostomum dentatum]|uniref:RING-type E3 ubiquitin transferase n=1 Tax=Oesophagostomum dentatum TaxID=61180 RepID=A0A0B1TC59_OESDE|nr:zinc finger, C3HC4 type [Oesophagostomum dentatum]